MCSPFEGSHECARNVLAGAHIHADHPTLIEHLGDRVSAHRHEIGGFPGQLRVAQQEVRKRPFGHVDHVRALLEGGRVDVLDAHHHDLVAHRQGLDEVIGEARRLRLGGVTVDVEQENKAISFDTLMYIHNNKTAALIECAMMIGAVLAGASEKEVSMIEQIANKVGIAFQIEDDILDVVSTSEEIGKPAGSDEKNGKNTYVLFKGIEQSKKDAEQYTREALQIFDELEYKNPFLRELLLYLVGRKN